MMTVIEMKRDWRTFGFSHFGAAWICMAFTCGPHHLDHGLHIAIDGRLGGPLDLLAVVVGLPVGVLWLGLRVEAFLGGRGDRFVPGDPRWLRAAPAASGIYLGGLGAACALVLAGHRVTPGPRRVGQRDPRRPVHGRRLVRAADAAGQPTVDGRLVGVGPVAVGHLPTCALMHAVWATYAVAGRYQQDGHGLVIDWLSVPAGLYFLLVVRGLYRESLRDWNDGPGEVTAEVSTPHAHPTRVGGPR